VTTVTGVIANNVITGSDVAGLSTVATGAGLVSASDHRNLFFGNAADVVGRAAGANSVFANPMYTGTSDFHLLPGSLAIDAGDDGSVPADLLIDLDGNPRIQGRHVDIGAYEAPEPGATLGAVASLSALVALARRRRRLGT
jgi:hypothetical protein